MFHTTTNIDSDSDVDSYIDSHIDSDSDTTTTGTEVSGSGSASTSTNTNTNSSTSTSSHTHTHTRTSNSNSNSTTIRSLVRPRASSPKCPSILHARSLSPRSVLFEFEYHEHHQEEADPERNAAQLLPHLWEPDLPHANSNSNSNTNSNTNWDFHQHDIPSYEDYFQDQSDSASSTTSIISNNNNNNSIPNLPYSAIARKPRIDIDIDIEMIGDSKRQTTHTRSNKRKLHASEEEFPSRCSVNLRHRKVSGETVEWLASSSSSSINSSSDAPCSNSNCKCDPIADTERCYCETITVMLPEHPSLALLHDRRHQHYHQQHHQQHHQHQHPVVEELWLGPVFESSETVLAAIATLPSSVVHLDLDLRNSLHLLPRVLPLLFARDHLKRLGLRVFGDAGAIEVAKWIRNNPNLERLDLSGNRIGSLGARTLVDGLVARGSYHHHRDNDNDNNDNDTKNENENEHRWHLTDLDLSCNCILDGDLFGRFLALDTTLTSLDLSYNWFGDGEVGDLCEGLRTNATLRRLDLRGCHRISSRGMEALLRCLAGHNTSLREIELQARDDEQASILEKIGRWLELNRAGRCLVKESLPVPVRASMDGGDRRDRDRDGDPSASSDLRDGCYGPNHRERVPMGLWPTVLEKSNARPDSVFYLVREGLGPRIANYRR